MSARLHAFVRVLIAALTNVPEALTGREQSVVAAAFALARAMPSSDGDDDDALFERVVALFDHGDDAAVLPWFSVMELLTPAHWLCALHEYVRHTPVSAHTLVALLVGTAMLRPVATPPVATPPVATPPQAAKPAHPKRKAPAVRHEAPAKRAQTSKARHRPESDVIRVVPDGRADLRAHDRHSRVHVLRSDAVRDEHFVIVRELRDILVPAHVNQSRFYNYVKDVFHNALPCCPPGDARQVISVASTVGGPLTLLTYDEAVDMYTELVQESAVGAATR